MNNETLSAALRLHACLCAEEKLTENERRLFGRLKKMLKLPTNKQLCKPHELVLRFGPDPTLTTNMAPGYRVQPIDWDGK